jgi:microcin C transport system substrate-binding protein
VLEKKHTVAWSGWSTSLRPQYWEHYHSINAHRPQTNNITNTDDTEMDRLIEAYRASLEALERQDLSRRIQTRIHEIGAYVPTFMVPYVREAFWRWWRLPPVPGTRLSDSLFDPFSSMTGGLFWLDEKLREQTQAAMKAGDVFEPLTKVDTTYKTATSD